MFTFYAHDQQFKEDEYGLAVKMVSVSVVVHGRPDPKFSLSVRPSKLDDFRPVAFTSHLMRTLAALPLTPGATHPGLPAVCIPARCWRGGCHPLPASLTPLPIWIREAEHGLGNVDSHPPHCNFWYLLFQLMKNQALFNIWVMVTALIRNATHASLCYSGLQPKIQIYIVMSVSSRVIIFAAIWYHLFHDLEVVWINMYINDSPIIWKNSVFHSTHSLQAYKTSKICFARQTLCSAGWLSKACRLKCAQN